MAFKCDVSQFKFTKVITLLRRKSRSQSITALNTEQMIIYNALNALYCALMVMQAVFCPAVQKLTGQNKTALERVQNGVECYLFFFTQSNKIIIGSITIINKAVTRCLNPFQNKINRLLHRPITAYNCPVSVSLTSPPLMP